MFSSTIPKKDDNGFILIDRDGKHFSKILNYLRNGILPSLKDDVEAKELLSESDFYCIEELKKHCQIFESSKEITIYPYGSTSDCTDHTSDGRCRTTETNAI